MAHNVHLFCSFFFLALVPTRMKIRLGIPSLLSAKHARRTGRNGQMLNLAEGKEEGQKICKSWKGRQVMVGCCKVPQSFSLLRSLEKITGDLSCLLACPSVRLSRHRADPLANRVWTCRPNQRRRILGRADVRIVESLDSQVRTPNEL